MKKVSEIQVKEAAKAIRERTYKKSYDDTFKCNKTDIYKWIAYVMFGFGIPMFSKSEVSSNIIGILFIILSSKELATK